MENCLLERYNNLLLGLILLTASPWISEGAEQTTFAKPEKNRLEVATAGSGSTSLPLLVALEGGYFAKRSLNVSVNQVGATVAVQGVISGTIDIYQGGTAAIAANLAVRILSTLPPPWTETRLFCSGRKALPLLRACVANRLPRLSPAPLGKLPFE
jgi:hypothetical protein